MAHIQAVAHTQAVVHSTFPGAVLPGLGHSLEEVRSLGCTLAEDHPSRALGRIQFVVGLYSSRWDPAPGDKFGVGSLDWAPARRSRSEDSTDPHHDGLVEGMRAVRRLLWEEARLANCMPSRY